MNSEQIASLPEGAKARQVFLSLKDEIANGRLFDGDSLPGEQKLAATFGVSRVTVRRALKSLADAGLVERRAGSGTVVRTASTSEMPMAMDFSTLMPQLAEMSEATEARLLSFNYEVPPDYVRKSMGLEPEARVQRATRVRLKDGTPFSHLTTYVPENIARNYSENDLANSPLFKLLERGGITIDQAHQSVSATLAGPETADALEIAVGSALLSLKRVLRDADGNVVEFLSALYRPDMFRLEMPLARVGEGSARHWEPAIGPANGKGEDH